jgi:hypothetical protein
MLAPTRRGIAGRTSDSKYALHYLSVTSLAPASVIPVLLILDAPSRRSKARAEDGRRGLITRLSVIRRVMARLRVMMARLGVVVARLSDCRRSGQQRQRHGEGCGFGHVRPLCTRIARMKPETTWM